MAPVIKCRSAHVVSTCKIINDALLLQLASHFWGPFPCTYVFVHSHMLMCKYSGGQLFQRELMPIWWLDQEEVLLVMWQLGMLAEILSNKWPLDPLQRTLTLVIMDRPWTEIMDMVNLKKTIIDKRPALGFSSSDLMVAAKPNLAAVGCTGWKTYLS